MSYGYDTGNDSNSYNPRTHSKVAEKAGFSMGNEEPRTLYIGNLDSSVTEEFLTTLFGQIGVVTKTKVIFDGANDPYAFVEFADHAMAAQALQTMNRRMLLEKEMKVNWAVEPGQQTVKIDTSSKYKLKINFFKEHYHVFVGDLSTEVDNKALKEAFAPFGEVSDAKVIRDVTTLKSKGYGFVSYPKRDEAERAIEQMNGQWLGRRTIRTNWATRKPGQGGAEGHTSNAAHDKGFEEIYNQTTGENTSVYVGNVAGGISEDDIRSAFERFGRISEVRIFKVQGYAFVKFDAKDSACRAIMQMNGGELGGNTIKCSWGKSQGPTGGSSGPGGGASSGGAGGYGYGAGSTGASTASAQQQYWEYYQRYYQQGGQQGAGNPGMQSWQSNYWAQQGGKK